MNRFFVRIRPGIPVTLCEDYYVLVGNELKSILWGEITKDYEGLYEANSGQVRLRNFSSDLFQSGIVFHRSAYLAVHPGQVVPESLEKDWQYKCLSVAERYQEIEAKFWKEFVKYEESI